MSWLPLRAVSSRGTTWTENSKGDLILGNFGDSEAQNETFLESVPSSQATDSCHREHK